MCSMEIIRRNSDLLLGFVILPAIFVADAVECYGLHNLRFIRTGRRWIGDGLVILCPAEIFLAVGGGRIEPMSPLAGISVLGASTWGSSNVASVPGQGSSSVWLIHVIPRICTLSFNSR